MCVCFDFLATLSSSFLNSADVVGLVFDFLCVFVLFCVGLQTQKSEVLLLVGLRRAVMMSWLTTCHSSYRYSQAYTFKYFACTVKYSLSLIKSLKPATFKFLSQVTIDSHHSKSHLLFLQALKFECHLKNALVMFLLSRAQGNINIAHYLYW